jgi:glycerol-3-phosphate dehydrogenase
MTDSSERFDLVVVGGGINGAGIARDAAKRGLSVALFEKSDFCSGTSAWSSRLIHGGLRYLEYFEIPLVFESLNERRYLQRIARNLVKPIRLGIPLYEDARRGRLLVRLGLAFYDLLSFRKSLPNHDMLGREAALRAEPGLNPDGLTGLARYYDAQVVFAERLVLDNLLDASLHGAVVRNYSPVIEILEAEGAVSGVAWRHPEDDSRHEARASAVINAAGPWVDSVLDTAGVQERDFVGGTKGSHIVVSRFEGAPRDAVYVEAAIDGRPFFILPWNGLVLIGTTDIRYSGDLDSPRITDEEVDYLLAETNRVFPGARLSRDAVHYAYAGVRPLPNQDAGPESAITRKHQIVENTDIAAGLYSIVGGKLTTYRSLAEQAVDRIIADGRAPGKPSSTLADPLPGSVELKAAKTALEAVDSLVDRGRERILAIYGGRARALLDGIREGRYPSGTLAGDGRVLCAEVGFAVDEEFARNLADIVHRRLMIGFDADQGRPYYEEIADLAAAHCGYDAERRERELLNLNRYADSFRIAD